jgi:uncharacterized membrane protein YphA (DoxX/SURF4 family)
MRKSLQILSLLAGIVFLISGIGKSVAVYEFSQILAQYEFDVLRFFAPLVIVVEIVLGLLLFFNAWLKQTSLLALCFVAVLSLGYFYGYFFVNITDCGCFGYFSFLNLPPLFTFIRNFVLMGILLLIFLKSNNLRKSPDKNEILIMGCILCAVCFITGYTFVEQKLDSTQYIAKEERIENSVLSEFLTTSKDSTYLVFVFSYSCPHCYNSIENLKQYERLGVADKVLALSFTMDSTTMERFNDIFTPDFQIKNYPSKQLFRLSNQFPVSYYIQNNTIKFEIRGLLPCGYILRQQLK